MIDWITTALWAAFFIVSVWAAYQHGHWCGWNDAPDDSDTIRELADAKAKIEAIRKITEAK